MVSVIIYIALVVFGAVLGSFAGATVWRLRAHQLQHDKKEGRKVDTKEFKRLKGLLNDDLAHDRSRCLNCGYTLQWYDLIPLISWVSLSGKCRHCRQPIGFYEPLIELGVVAYFVISYAFWPFDLSSPLAMMQFIAWLIAGVCFAIQFSYDFKWSLLDSRVSYILIGLGLLSTAVTIIQSASPWAALLSAFWSVFIFGGIYLGVWAISRKRWIGEGDVVLGLALGLLLANWENAFLGLFLANFIGCLIVVPQMARRKLTANSRIPFGPLLILGAIIAQLVGPVIIGAYLNLL